jgi:hypothetical protein
MDIVDPYKFCNVEDIWLKVSEKIDYNVVDNVRELIREELHLRVQLLRIIIYNSISTSMITRNPRVEL